MTVLRQVMIAQCDLVSAFQQIVESANEMPRFAPCVLSADASPFCPTLSVVIVVAAPN
ncbi:MAG: hypothetical protein THHGLFOP_000999 [Candidatus Fervidibacter sp.]|jgi:hypothetical protein